MTKILGLLVLSLSFALSACNDDDEHQDVVANPQPNCKIHCAP